MDNPVITLSLAQLSLAFIPVAITLAILVRWSFGVKNALYALGRMLLQLLAIGYVLAWIFGASNGLLILLVLAIMLSASAWIAVGTVPELRRSLAWSSLQSIALGGGVTLALITQLVLQIEPWYLPRYMIPLAGMVFANAMTAVSLAAEPGEWKALMRSGPYLRLLVVVFAAFFCLHGPMVFFPVFVRSLGGGLADVGLAWAFMLSLEIPLLIGAGWIAARKDPRWLLAIGILAGGVRWIACGLVGIG